MRLKVLLSKGFLLWGKGGSTSVGGGHNEFH
jgi:hypothetical protein